jgi:hypothetical protein
MKDINECRERLRGIFNITVTPFTPAARSTSRRCVKISNA